MPHAKTASAQTEAPRARQPGLDKLTLEFGGEPDEFGLRVVVDEEGITFACNDNMVRISKREAQQIQEFLANACAHVWRVDHMGQLGALGREYSDEPTQEVARRRRPL